MPLLALDGISAGYGRGAVLHGASLAIEAGEVVALLGGNGAGKSTLLRVAAGILAPMAGRVLVGGRDLSTLGAREAARLVSGVPQDDATDFAFTVRQVVALGRIPHLSPWRGEGEADRAAVAAALAATDLAALADRPVPEVSGGERRRASIARCLAQDAPILLLDEPTGHLDLGHETRVLGLLRALARERARAVLAALHDVNLAALYADRVVLLREGRVVADGPPRAVLDAGRLRDVYGAEVHVLAHPDRPDVPVVVPAERRP